MGCRSNLNDQLPLLSAINSEWYTQSGVQYARDLSNCSPAEFAWHWKNTREYPVRFGSSIWGESACMRSAFVNLHEGIYNIRKEAAQYFKRALPLTSCLKSRDGLGAPGSVWMWLTSLLESGVKLADRIENSARDCVAMNSWKLEADEWKLHREVPLVDFEEGSC